jgi:hypothetical protein
VCSLPFSLALGGAVCVAVFVLLLPFLWLVGGTFPNA